MKKLFVLFLLLVTVSAFAAGVPSPSTPRPMVDANGNLVSTANPMPVTGSISVTIGSATFSASGAMEVYPTNYNTGSTTWYTPLTGAAIQKVTIATNAKFLTLYATGTFEHYFTATVTASGVPDYSVSRIPVGASITVYVGQTATPTTIQADQVGQ